MVKFYRKTTLKSFKKLSSFHFGVAGFHSQKTKEILLKFLSILHKDLSFPGLGPLKFN